MHKILAIVLLTLLLFCIIYYCEYESMEGFKTMRQKTEAIADWFNQNSRSPEYIKYRSEIPESNIAEYEAVKRQSDGSLTSEEVAKIILQ